MIDWVYLFSVIWVIVAITYLWFKNKRMNKNVREDNFLLTSKMVIVSIIILIITGLSYIGVNKTIMFFGALGFLIGNVVDWLIQLYFLKRR